jgi:5-methyltetrahydropteroyltriglutamate--homocysteine methyltransferase
MKPAAPDGGRLRVDVVGSLRKPDALLDAYRRHAEGDLDGSGLRAAQDAAVGEVIRRQEELGLPVVTDGELRRINFQDSFGQAVAGFDAPPNSWGLMQRMHAASRLDHGRVIANLGFAGPAVVTRRPAVERLRKVANPPRDEYRFASAVASRPVKVTLVGPDRVAQRFDWQRSSGVYAGLDVFVDDVVRIQREMIGELVEAGCRCIQHDEPGYTAYVDAASLEAMRARGEDPAANLERSIRADNAIIAGFPGVTFSLHVCRGNPPGGWHREGFYDAIAERLFGGLDHQRLLLEYDSPRAGSFEPLRFVRKGTVAVLGLVSTKVAEVETLEFLLRRIDEASRYLPLEQLAISPQCGFGHFDEDVQWRKLEVLLETARRVWG